MASFAATLAIGYPVAFEANADERDTLGLISMAIISSFYLDLLQTEHYHLSKITNASHHFNGHISHALERQYQIMSSLELQ